MLLLAPYLPISGTRELHHRRLRLIASSTNRSARLVIGSLKYMLGGNQPS